MAATPRKRDGKVPSASKKGNPKSKAAGQKGAAKAKRKGHNQPGRDDNR
jgi:hypothetical protein